jgi:hypothetical protein
VIKQTPFPVTMPLAAKCLRIITIEDFKIWISEIFHNQKITEKWGRKIQQMEIRLIKAMALQIFRSLMIMTKIAGRFPLIITTMMMTPPIAMTTTPPVVMMVK